MTRAEINKDLLPHLLTEHAVLSKTIADLRVLTANLLARLDTVSQQMEDINAATRHHTSRNQRD